MGLLPRGPVFLLVAWRIQAPGSTQWPWSGEAGRGFHQCTDGPSTDPVCAAGSWPLLVPEGAATGSQVACMGGSQGKG